jgi:hypothetical protein
LAEGLKQLLSRQLLVLHIVLKPNFEKEVEIFGLNLVFEIFNNL